MRTLSRLLQVLLAVVGWVVFGWLWWTAFRTGPTDSQLRGTLIVGTIDVGIVLVTILWVRWNIGVYRRKGPRTTVPPVDYAYDRDCKGVPVVGVDACRQSASRFLVIDLEGEGDSLTKVYRTK
ncbi:MAG: hypothetical protein QMD76_07135 [Anaerosomatales bacterium]|nr:hypothetical protein [Coriobacteriia bacterium]MDI6693059.1 hypothetical protein [Anaerosomatales bacterium]